MGMRSAALDIIELTARRQDQRLTSGRAVNKMTHCMKQISECSATIWSNLLLLIATFKNSIKALTARFHPSYNA
jgi:hypothetical protein